MVVGAVEAERSKRQRDPVILGRPTEHSQRPRGWPIPAPARRHHDLRRGRTQRRKSCGAPIRGPPSNERGGRSAPRCGSATSRTCGRCQPCRGDRSGQRAGLPPPRHRASHLVRLISTGGFFWGPPADSPYRHCPLLDGRENGRNESDSHVRAGYAYIRRVVEDDATPISASFCYPSTPEPGARCTKGGVGDHPIRVLGGAQVRAAPSVGCLAPKRAQPA